MEKYIRNLDKHKKNIKKVGRPATRPKKPPVKVQHEEKPNMSSDSDSSNSDDDYEEILIDRRVEEKEQKKDNVVNKKKIVKKYYQPKVKQDVPKQDVKQDVPKQPPIKVKKKNDDDDQGGTPPASSKSKSIDKPKEVVKEEPVKQRYITTFTPISKTTYMNHHFNKF